MSSSAPLSPIPTEAFRLDDTRTLDSTLVERYGHLLPDTLIRSTLDVAGGPQVADTDVAALAEAALRAPEPAQP